MSRPLRERSSPGSGAPVHSRRPAAAGRLLRRGALLLLAAVVLSGCGIPRWPVEGPLTSPYGVRMRGWSPDLHRGVDVAVPTGTEVRAMTGGSVRFAGERGAYGRVIWLDHGGDLLTVYAHLSEIRVRRGERVDAGQIVGLSGNSGNSTAPHLHFEIWRRGREVDPVQMLGGPPPSG